MLTHVDERFRQVGVLAASVFCALLVFGIVNAEAQTQLVLRNLDNLRSEIEVVPGDRLDLELFIDVGNIEVNGISALIVYNPTYLSVVDQDNAAGIQPCKVGDFLPGLVLQNELDASQSKQSRILYSIGSISGAASGDGTVAEISFEVLAPVHTAGIDILVGEPVPQTIYSVAGAIPITESFDTLTSASVHILGTPAWDVNQDGNISILDLVTVGQHFGEQPLTEPRADVNGDGKVNILDLVTIGQHFGEEYMPN